MPDYVSSQGINKSWGSNVTPDCEVRLCMDRTFRGVLPTPVVEQTNKAKACHLLARRPPQDPSSFRGYVLLSFRILLFMLLDQLYSLYFFLTLYLQAP
eukprot:1635862-Amphidinium_carterae.2